MKWWEFCTLGVGLTAVTAAVDYCHARYVKNLVAKHLHAAARWSVGQWAASVVGLLLVVKVTAWLLPFEMCGLYLGTLFSGDAGTPTKT